MSPAGSSSSRARIGVMPTPPAISRVPGCVRCNEVNAPYGPSTNARLPTRMCRRPALVLPTALAVRRNVRPSGAADSENGFASHQWLCPGKRQMQNWPARAGSLSRWRPVTCTDTTLSDSGTTAVTSNRW